MEVKVKDGHTVYHDEKTYQGGEKFECPSWAFQYHMFDVDLVAKPPSGNTGVVLPAPAEPDAA